ncbi:MAG: NifU family protein [Bdellovibrionales bacterium]|nr:NifU family protein [Bdellovibrionales bacterium]
MNVEVLKTENAQERKFLLDQNISVREKRYEDSTQALSSPVASKIFGFPWTEAITVGTNFVTVTKQDWVEWEVLEDPLSGLIQEHFANQTEAIEENPEMESKADPKLDSPEAKKILTLIENEINPSLASHGGYVVLHSVENNNVYLEMGGGCQGCAMSYMTLKEGIEGAIKNVVPEIQQVIDVTNHNEGENPFYS